VGKLSSKTLAKLDQPGRYAAGDGLYLFVDSKQRRYWQLRYMIGGRRHDMAIGPERHFSLGQAREAAMKLRLTLIQGLDPLEERKAAEVAGTTFAEAARNVHTARAAGWRNGKHKDQWLTTLEKHVFPVIGEKPLAGIERSDVLNVLEPVWLATPETTRRVRQRIAAVIDWGVAGSLRLDLWDLLFTHYARPHTKFLTVPPIRPNSPASSSFRADPSAPSPGPSTSIRQQSIAVSSQTDPYDTFLFRSAVRPLSGRIEAKYGRTKDDANAISGALSLLTNVVLAWNTAAMQTEIAAKPDQYPTAHLTHIAPVAHRHINMNGVMRFTIEPHHQLVQNSTRKLGKAAIPINSITQRT